MEHGKLKKIPDDYPNDLKMNSNVLFNHGEIIKSLRRNADRYEDEYMTWEQMIF